LLAVAGIDWLATGGFDGGVCLWDLTERCEGATFPGGATAVAVHPNGRRVAAASLEQTGTVWDAEARGPTHELSGHDGAVTCVAYSPDGRWLASGSDDRTLRLWDAGTGTAAAVREVDSQIKALAFSPDGRFLFTGNGNTTCYAFSLEKLVLPQP